MVERDNAEFSWEEFTRLFKPNASWVDPMNEHHLGENFFILHIFLENRLSFDPLF